MKPKIFEGKVMNDILIAAKNHFHQDQQQLIINVLEEKKGIFGLGAYIKAEVSLNLDPIEEGKKYLLQLLNDFNLTGTVEIIPSKQSITFNVNSDNNGLIIGREGKTLQSIQVLTSQVVNQYTNKHLKVLVDIGSYKENQIKKLEALAKKTAKEVLHSKIDAKLDPMNAYDRRIIHNTLSDILQSNIKPNRPLSEVYF